MMNNNNKKLGLFISFFRIAFFTLGGGAVMLPLMEEEFVQRRKWISDEDMIDVYTLCNTLPGVIALNSSLMIGRMVAGFSGAVFAVLGVLLPSVIIITGLASVIHYIADYPLVALAFMGIRAGVTALLVTVVIVLGKKGLKGKREVAIALFAFLALEVLEINAVLVVLLSAILGWVLFRKDSRGEI
jgi:chromate transporter